MPDDERIPFVARESAADPEVMPIVLELLRDADEAGLDRAPSDAGESRLGARIGKYRITGLLGRGGMGQVYAACDTELDRMVALKVIAVDGALQRNPAERLMQEAKAASALNHPYIVTVYEIVRNGPEIALAMELVEGQSLREYCRVPQPGGRVAVWGRQIAQALAVTHERGIVHRDIKPENIMERPDGAIKVLDFGLARRLEGGSSSVSGMLVGTLNYMSPEQTRGESSGPASDIFSLGAVLWELLDGRHPFGSPSPIDTAHAIAHAEPAPLRHDVRRDLSELLRAMLAKDPAKRPTAKEVEQRLTKIELAPLEVRPGAAFSGMFLRIGAALTVLAVAVLLWWTYTGRLFRPQPLLLEPVAHMPAAGVSAAAISPDGKLLAYAPLDGPVSIRPLTGGEPTPLATPRGLQVNRIAWLTNQRELLVSGSLGSDSAPAIWVLSMDAAEAPPPVFSKGRDAAPSPDGGRIALASADGSLIWVANRDGSGQRNVRAGGVNTTFSSMVWSLDGRRLSFMMLRQAGASPSIDTYQTFETVDVESGQIVASVAGLPMYSGTVLDNGRILCLPWAYPANSHGGELIEIRTDPRTGEFLGQSRRAMPYAWDSLYSSFSSSRDGSVMALVGASAYTNLKSADLIDTASGVSLANIQQLTFGRSEDYPHAWTRDSKIVLFESNRSNKDVYQLFQAGLEHRNTSVLYTDPKDATILPHMTPDGEWLLFRRKATHGNAELMRLRQGAGSGGARAELIFRNGETPDEFRCGLSVGSRCVVRSTEGDEFVYRELDPLHGKGRVLARTTITPQLFFDWDLSPDGKTVASPNHDPKSAQIRLIALDAVAGADHRTIDLDGGFRNLSSVAWAADGKWLFVSAAAASGGVLLHTALDGRTQRLLETAKATFAVPSPNGRHIVFPDRINSSSVQILKSK